MLALGARADIVGLSKRATQSDSYLAARARGLPQRRATAEQALAARPDIVVRSWGGDEGLLADLAARGARIVRIEDAVDFTGIRANIRRVALALRAGAAGAALVARMDRQLARSRGAWGGAPALYLTSGGDTAGAGTLIDAILTAAGLTNLAGGRGYRAVPLERLVARPPSAVVEGFFDPGASATQRWSIGRHAALQRLLAGRTVVSLPASILGCPAWFAGDAVERIAGARGAARRSRLFSLHEKRRRRCDARDATCA